MTDRPISFSAPMIRALRDGRKTQTRRVLTRARVFATPESRAFTLRGADLTRALQGAARFRRLDGDGWYWEADAFDWQAPAARTGWMAHLGFAPGDRLWAREAWRTPNNWDSRNPAQLVVSCLRAGYDRPWCPIAWEADGTRTNWGDWREHEPGRLRASIHLPRAFSRLTLIVTDVRVQRLQEISEDDAIAEGIEGEGGSFDRVWYDYESPRGLDGGLTRVFDCPVKSYASLWDTLHKPGHRWADNPWVVALTFATHHRNIDQMEAA